MGSDFGPGLTKHHSALQHFAYLGEMWFVWGGGGEEAWLPCVTADIDVVWGVDSDGGVGCGGAFEAGDCGTGPGLAQHRAALQHTSHIAEFCWTGGWI